MATTTLKRGALPSPRHLLAAATPHRAMVGAPPNFLYKPQQISFWGNNEYGDCVTAEEAFAKACHVPEIFIPDNVVIDWATNHGVCNGAQLTTVLGYMQNDGFNINNCLYNDGPYSSVNWADASTLQSAIYNGPVKFCIAADQIDAAWNSTNGGSGWFALNFQPDANYDHCVSICGYGSLSWLAQQFQVQVPSGVDGTKPGYAMFTWKSIGIIDEPSLLAISCEAWLRQPTTVINNT